jgi:hypothetical protein
VKPWRCVALWLGNTALSKCRERLLKNERSSEQAISSTNAFVLYGVGTRFGSRSGPRFPDKFLLIFFSPSWRMRAYYFTLDNARDFQAISNSLFIGRHIFRLYEVWGAERAVKWTNEQTFYAEFLLTRAVRLGVHKFSEKSRNHLLILGMKKVPVWAPIDVKHERTLKRT